MRRPIEIELSRWEKRWGFAFARRTKGHDGAIDEHAREAQGADDGTTRPGAP
jgi:hypothetical protein